jgi:hypothetical protein
VILFGGPFNTCTVMCQVLKWGYPILTKSGKGVEIPRRRLVVASARFQNQLRFAPLNP